MILKSYNLSLFNQHRPQNICILIDALSCAHAYFFHPVGFRDSSLGEGRDGGSCGSYHFPFLIDLAEGQTVGGRDFQHRRNGHRKDAVLAADVSAALRQF